MNKYIADRGRGKTQHLIYESARTGYPIVCISYDMKNYIIHLAQFLGLEIPEPICINEPWNNKKLDRVLVDDADAILELLLRQRNNNISIEELTMS